MMQRGFVLMILVSHAVSEPCVTYTFEEEYNALFTSNTGICSNLREWNIGYFEDTDLTSHNERSTKFIHPHESLSCTTSYMFPVTPGGIIEINIFMESALISDQIQVMAMEYVEGGSDAFVGQAFNTPVHPATFVKGWHTLAITVFGGANMTCYISVMGMASLASTVLVDSFRYIPPGMDENECVIYQNKYESTTDTTIESTTESATESITETTVKDTTDTITDITTETTIWTTTASTAEITNDITTESTIWTTPASTTWITTASPAEITTEATTKTTRDITTGSPIEPTTESIRTTELPTTLASSDENNHSFWTSLRITLIVFLSATIIILLSVVSYCCCRANSRLSVGIVRS